MEGCLSVIAFCVVQSAYHQGGLFLYSFHLVRLKEVPFDTDPNTATSAERAR